jgi:hypothetical protein
MRGITSAVSKTVAVPHKAIPSHKNALPQCPRNVSRHFFNKTPPPQQFAHCKSTPYESANIKFLQEKEKEFAKNSEKEYTISVMPRLYEFREV